VGQWLIRWRIQNLTEQTIKVIAARLPHGKFRSEEKKFSPSLEIAPGRGTAEFEIPVRCDEPLGTIVENAFVILFAEWRGVLWRIFVRLRITMGQESEPTTKTELITFQRVGFSGAR
jgi:hypothetical protein